MAGFLVWTHLVLDFFTGGEALFYPLTTARYFIGIGPTLTYEAETLLPTPLLPYISYQLLGIVLIFFVLATILFVKKLFQINADVHERAKRTRA
jgi:hypothetical protein